MTNLILASSSNIRGQLLRNAGLEFDIVPAGVDETELKKVMSTETLSVKGDDLAEFLAEAKAIEVSQKHPQSLGIGADQTLQMGTTLYDKASDLSDARAKLLALRGNTHVLYSAVTCAKGGQVVWRYVDAAHLTMRNFSAEFLGKYLALLGDDLLTSVGGYKLESQGAQLFEKISGDYFTILGMPLLPLLHFLRSQDFLDQ